MMRDWLVGTVLSLLGCCGPGGCSGGNCVPGKTLECSCGGGNVGVQICQDDKRYGPCSCNSTQADGTIGRDGHAERSDADVIEATAGSLSIVSLDADKTTMVEGDYTTIRATVTGPAVAGDLIDPSLSKIYDTFLNKGSGRFELTLQWDEINHLRPITFINQQARTFAAKFSDSAGGSVSAELVITLACPQAQKPACCSGACLDLNTNPYHCGKCGHACDLGRCSGAKCYNWGECIPSIPNGGPYKTCADYCTAKGKSCSLLCSSSIGAQKLYYSKEKCDMTPIGNSYVQQQCQDLLNFNSNEIPWFRCCCSEL